MIKIVCGLGLVLHLMASRGIAEQPIITVDRIEDRNIAVIEVCHQDEIKMVDIPAEDFNHPVAEGNKISASAAVGSFGEGFKDADGNVWYQFKSYDDTVWWVLTAEEIGFVPEVNKSYTLVYYNNGTTDCTECPEEFDCECEVYDDIFLAVYEGGN